MSETGHAKNIANFEKVISFCESLNDKYNPTNNDLKIESMKALLIGAKNSMSKSKDTFTELELISNNREKDFANLRKLSTRIINALIASGANDLTIEDAKSVNLKIQGKRANPIIKSENPQDIIKTISVSQQSFDSKADILSKLIKLIKAEKLYQPNENDLKVESLESLYSKLIKDNNDTIKAEINNKQAIGERDKILYENTIGIVDIAQKVKNYIKSAYGSTTVEFKEVSNIEFRPQSTIN